MRSSVRYWMASAICSAPMVSLSARSAIVRATRRMRSWARASDRAARRRGGKRQTPRRSADRTPREARAEWRRCRRPRPAGHTAAAGRRAHGADGLRAFLLCAAARGERLVLDRLHGDLEVDAVEQRPGQTAQILLHALLRAGAAVCAVPAARTGFMAAMS